MTPGNRRQGTPRGAKSDNCGLRRDWQMRADGERAPGSFGMEQGLFHVWARTLGTRPTRPRARLRARPSWKEWRGDVSVVVTGSLAFDHIMSFPGYFKDHILPDKVHLLNVSFLVTSLKRQRGGTGGNIAYSAALLGLRPLLIAAAGSDFAEYRAALERVGVDTSAILVSDDDFSASAFITTDQANNQITGFYPGAMARAAARALPDLAYPNTELVIIAPDNPVAMVRFARECREQGWPYIYDPGQQTILLSGEELREGLTGARVLIGNDYELAVLGEKTGLDRAALRERVELVITTLGSEGAQIDQQGDVTCIPIAPVERVVDPTGAGDAFRAGLLLGLTRGFALDVTGRIAALAASYAVEQLGTQEHRYTTEEFTERFNRTFPEVAPLSSQLVPGGKDVAAPSWQGRR